MTDLKPINAFQSSIFHVALSSGPTLLRADPIEHLAAP